MQNADDARVQPIKEIEAGKLAIQKVLTTRTGEDPSHPTTGFPVLELADGRNRSRSGLDRASVIADAEQAVLQSVGGVTVQGIEPEMIANGQVSAVNVRFEIIASGEIGELRVEMPT